MGGDAGAQNDTMIGSGTHATGVGPRVGPAPGVRGRTLLVRAALAVTAFELYVLVAPGSARLVGAVDDLLLGVAGAVAAWACWRRAHREQQRARSAWLFLTAGCVVFAVGQPYFAVAFVRDLDTLPGDLCNAAAIVLAVVGLIRLGGRAPLATTWALGTDGFVVAGSVVFAVWVFVLAPAARDSSQPLMTQLPTLFDLAGTVVLVALVLMLGARWPGDSPTVALLGAGFAVIGLANLGFSVETLRQTYGTGDKVIDVGWFAGFLLVAVGALWESRPAPEAAFRRQWLLTLAMPSGATVVVVLIGVEEGLRRRLDAAGFALGGGVLLAILIRQFVTLVENRRLTLDLERRVEDRTRELERSGRHFRGLVQHSSDLIIVLTPGGQVRYVSPAVVAVLGLQPEQARGNNVLEVVHREDLPHAQAWLAGFPEDDHHPTLRCRVRNVDGTWRHVEAVGSRLPDQTGEVSVVLNVRDVTDRTLLEDRLRFQAQHDPLTGLANRTLLQDRVRHALNRTERTAEQIAVLFVDLDQFKRLNDSAGHSVGDAALVAVAEVISAHIRPSDTASRFGGDEFAVLLEGTTPERASEVAARLVAELTELPVADGRFTLTGASIGVAVSRGAGEDSEALLRDADLAMYQAKATGRGRVALFHPAMRQDLIEQLALEVALRDAVHAKALDVVYQPIVFLADGTLQGVEVLVRWRGPGGEAVPPSLFIPLAEQIGLIGQIDAWVLRQACRDAMGWHESGGLPELTINVNFSASDLRDPGLSERVAEILEETGMLPHRLMLEITETVVLGGVTGAAAQLERLRDTGVRVSLDDFGTGYSSLTTLRDLPLDEIKIDGSFVAGLEEGLAGTRVLKAVLGMAQSMDLHVVAEAVETSHQAATLRDLHCELAQGWLFAAPMSAPELWAWASERVSLEA